MNPEILTIAQAAEYLQFHPDKVYRMARSGELRAAKIGKEWRIRRADIDRLLDERARDVAPEGRPGGGRHVRR